MLNQRTLGKSRLAAMMATVLAGYGVVYGGVPTRTPRRKVNTHPMITAPDGEIRLWNDTVTTRQVLRARIKPWKSLVARRMWESRP